MKDIWQNETEYIGIQLNIKEISLISKILGNLTFNQRKKFLSKEEENLYIDLYCEFNT